MRPELQFLREQQVNEHLIQEVERYSESYPVAEEVWGRVVKPSIPFYGREVLEMAVSGLLQGENLLLTGAKATGKNVLAENLAYFAYYGYEVESLKSFDNFSNTRHVETVCLLSRRDK